MSASLLLAVAAFGAGAVARQDVFASVDNCVFSNGVAVVEFKAIPGAALEIDVEPPCGMTDIGFTDVTENGVRRVTIRKAESTSSSVRSVSLVRRNCLRGRTTKPLPLYAPNEVMTFEVGLSGFAGRDRTSLFLKWRRSGDDGKTESGRVAMSRPFVYHTSLDRPGFVRLEGMLEEADGKPVVVECNDRRGNVICDLGAGVDIGRIRPAVPAPSDFDAFWKKRRDKLEKTTWRGREQLEEIASPLDEVRVFRLKVPCVEGVDLVGYFTIPRKPGKYPACAFFQGYGASFGPYHTQTPSTEMLKHYARGRVLLSASPHGLELGRDATYYKAFRKSLRSNGCDHGFDPMQNADPEKPYYSGMSYRVLRALDYLKSREEWNGKDLVVTGGSQGGLQSIWCAALDHDVTDCSVFIPWNCDIGGTELGRNRGTWYVKWVPGLGYYDACSMASRIPGTCRVNVTMAGLGDYICPPSGVMAFYNSVTAPKKIVFVQNAQHGNCLESRPQKFTLEGDAVVSAN